MEANYQVGNGKILVQTDEYELEGTVRDVKLEIDEHRDAIYSEAYFEPVSYVSNGQTVTITAQFVREDDTYFKMRRANAPKKPVRQGSRVWTTVVDLTVGAISEAAEVCGAQSDDVFEVEDHEDGYKLTWEV